MWTPAEPKPIPASEAPSIIAPRASTSSPFSTARRRYIPPYSSALADQMSATGLAPGGGDWAPGGAEADPGERGPEHPRPPRLDVRAFLPGAPQVHPAVLERPGRPDVSDGVSPLVGRPVVRALRLRTSVVGPGDVGLGGVTHDVEAAGRGDLGGHRYREEGVDHPAVGPEVGVRDTGLHPLVRDIQDGDRRRLRSGARGRRDREQGLQGDRKSVV